MKTPLTPKICFNRIIPLVCLILTSCATSTAASLEPEVTSLAATTAITPITKNISSPIPTETARVQSANGTSTPVETTSTSPLLPNPSAPLPSTTPTASPTSTPTQTPPPSPTAISPQKTPVLSPTPTRTLASTSTPLSDSSATSKQIANQAKRYLFVSQDEQMMYVYEDGLEVRKIPISTGVPVANAFTPAWSGVVGDYLGGGPFRNNLRADNMWYLFPGSWGSILIHSVPYTRNGNLKIYDRLDALGLEPVSNGCVRISPEDAKWLKAWNPVGASIRITRWSGQIGPPDESLPQMDVPEQTVKTTLRNLTPHQLVSSQNVGAHPRGRPVGQAQGRAPTPDY